MPRTSRLAVGGPAGETTDFDADHKFSPLERMQLTAAVCTDASTPHTGRALLGGGSGPPPQERSACVGGAGICTDSSCKLHAFQWREFMVGIKISGLTGGPSYCQPGGAGHASLSSTPLVPRGASASRREDTALAAHHTPWHSGEHSGLYKILFPIFACSSLVISARGHTPQASNHSMMRLH